jgi:hypothetical protein
MVWPLSDELPCLLIEGVEFDEMFVRNPPLTGSPMGMTFVIMSESLPQVEIHELTLCLAQHIHLLRAKLIVALGRSCWIVGLKERIQVRILTPLLVQDPSFCRRVGTR